jgi:hypothetical protein
MVQLTNVQEQEWMGYVYLHDCETATAGAYPVTACDVTITGLDAKYNMIDLYGM